MTRYFSADVLEDMIPYHYETADYLDDLDGGFWLRQPERTVPSIESVARTLANMARWGGRTRRFYSVAQHSVLVSYLVPPEHAYAALMHDAHEAHVGDLPTPVKRLLGSDYRIVEDAWRRRYESVFSFATGLDVTAGDMAALELERQELLPDSGRWGTALPFSPPDLAARVVQAEWGPVTARCVFVARFNETKGARCAASL